MLRFFSAAAGFFHARQPIRTGSIVRCGLEKGDTMRV